MAHRSTTLQRPVREKQSLRRRKNGVLHSVSRALAGGEKLIDSQQSFLLEFTDVQGARPYKLIIVANELLPAANYHHVAASERGFDKVFVSSAGKLPKSEGVGDVSLDS